jgi:hypothetical protein
MKTLNTSFVVEAALAGLFAAAFVMPAAAQDAPKGDAPSDKPMPMKKAPHAKKGADKVHCLGVNSCKGKSACAVEGGSSCKGKNECKGKGWVSLTSKKCASKKGTVAPMAAPAAAPAAK